MNYKLFQILDHEGKLVQPKLLPNWDDKKLQQIYKTMLFLRKADRKLIALQRTGRSGTYPSMEGQEACQMGSIEALQKSDWIFPAFRELGATLLHGMPLHKIYLYWMGDEWGSHVEANVAPVSIPVGSHPLHAVGVAWAFKLQKKDSITLSYFSDGATSEGSLYEAMNFATVFNVPSIFFCQNNQWAISTPRSKQTASKTLAQKAVAVDMESVQIDGNDIFAVYVTMQEAVKRAREGKGPTFIEAVTYRLASHTTSDDAKKYRSEEEEAHWRLRDPLIRLKKFLESRGLWSEAFEKEIEEEASAKIDEAVKLAEATEQKPGDIFDYHYETLTPELKLQKDKLMEELGQ